jgi:putative ABC transport system permease protein
MIAVQFADVSIKEGALADIEAVLRRSHHLSENDKNDFSISSPDQILDQMQIITGVFTLFLGAIGAISLLVAGIGIMNIMLVSVTERTREIGIRKAVGAKRRDILIQFLMEAGMLSLFGGILGIILGALISYGISTIDLGGGTTINAVINPAIVIGVTIISFLIGMVSSTYPAMRAAKMDPITALNYG